MVRYEVVIIGAGAAGLMCALTAGQRGRRVLILEHAAEAGKKILISGGGRCNFTNIHTTPANFLSANPHFAKSALARYTPADFVALLEKHRITYHEKTLGQLFCDRSARDVVEMLVKEVRAAGVQLELGCRVAQVRRTDVYEVETSRGVFGAEALVVATGGLSIPKIGATDLGYRIGKQFGHRIEPCRPALVPLTYSGSEVEGLSGLSAMAVASCGGQSFREKMLITHRGLSGPAILQVSSYWHSRQPLVLDLLPDGDLVEAAQARPQVGLRKLLSESLPQRWADRWLALQPDLRQLNELLHGWRLTPTGTEGYEKAEVTAGGIDTRELSSKTMESRLSPGLFFVGEVVDVTGHLGGFNFQWAWASGHAAGESV